MFDELVGKQLSVKIQNGKVTEMGQVNKHGRWVGPAMNKIVLETPFGRLEYLVCKVQIADGPWGLLPMNGWDMMLDV